MLILATSLTFGLTGCGEEAERDALIEQIDSLKTEKAELESTVAELKDMATAEKIRTGTEVYVVVINISQSHFTLDLEEHMKDQPTQIALVVQSLIQSQKAIYISCEKYNSNLQGSTMQMIKGLKTANRKKNHLEIEILLFFL